MLRKLAIVGGVVGAIAVMVAGGAQSQNTAAPNGFRLCNLSSVDIEVAKALNTGNKNAQGGHIIISEGWYKFAKGECAILWSGKLQYRYYLLYGQAKSVNKEWKGDIPICVSRQPFTITADLCPPDKYRRMFFQVDTGDNDGWTQNLRD